MDKSRTHIKDENECKWCWDIVSRDLNASRNILQQWLNSIMADGTAVKSKTVADNSWSYDSCIEFFRPYVVLIKGYIVYNFRY